ncbi:MAG: RICIN domain-containing protein [Actinomycetota bacterium]
MAAAIAVTGVVGIAPSANAATNDYKNRATSYCLDSNSSRTVYTRGCNSGSYQKWVDSSAGSGRLLKNLATSYCLDSNSSGNVYANACSSGNRYQQWTISSGVIKNVATGRCLDSNTSREVYTRTCNSGSFQKWD